MGGFFGASTKQWCDGMQPLCEFVQEELGGKVSKVAISARLTDSPCILVTSQHGWSANMQRIMKSQPMGDNRAMDYMKGEKIMEINPDNAVRSCCLLYCSSKLLSDW